MTKNIEETWAHYIDSALGKAGVDLRLDEEVFVKTKVQSISGILSGITETYILVAETSLDLDRGEVKIRRTGNTYIIFTKHIVYLRIGTKGIKVCECAK